MTTANDMMWGRYRNYEGPMFWGKHRFKVPRRPTYTDCLVAVTASTEGNYDSYNGYDGQGASVGLLQVTERAYYQVSQLLGTLAVKSPASLSGFNEEINNKGLVFKTNSNGRWRFFFKSGKQEVDTWEEQQRMFFLESSGRVHTWDEGSKIYAKQLAAAICTIFETPIAQEIQRQFMAIRIKQYAFGKSKKVVGSAPDTDIGKAFVAAYLSFAVNNPARANKHLEIALKSSRNTKWGLSWLIDVLRELTFGPGISIYPDRYNAFRKKLEKFYGLDLPNMADELKAWGLKTEHTFGFQAKEVQQALIFLGHDIGPKKDDGWWGDKSRAAMFDFEKRSGVPEAERDGMPDPWSMANMRKALEEAGYDKLGWSG